MLQLLGTEQVTLEVAVPASGEVGDYILEVWMVNQEHKRISEKHTFTVTATAAPASCRRALHRCHRHGF